MRGTAQNHALLRHLTPSESMTMPSGWNKGEPTREASNRRCFTDTGAKAEPEGSFGIRELPQWA